MNRLAEDPERLARRALEAIEREVVPLTREGVRRGDKVFGAAILDKSVGALVVAGTNRETDCPLWHGEVVAITRFWELPSTERPEPASCLFVSTHEPCSMCLSAITWAGFDNFVYLWSYEDSRDSFQIPHDLRILREVFGCSDGGYRRDNAYWTSQSIDELIEACPPAAQTELRASVERLRQAYAEMSEVYQASKGGGEIPLS